MVVEKKFQRIKDIKKLTKYSPIGFSRALLYDFCISVCLSAWAICKALASKRPMKLREINNKIEYAK